MHSKEHFYVLPVPFACPPGHDGPPPLTHLDSANLCRHQVHETGNGARGRAHEAADSGRNRNVSIGIDRSASIGIGLAEAGSPTKASR